MYVELEPADGDEYSEGQIRLIQRVTSYDYELSGDTVTASTESLKLSFTNRGNKALTDIAVTLGELPIELPPSILLPSKVFGGDIIDMLGWVLKEFVREPVLLTWRISDPKVVDVIRPGETLDLDVMLEIPLVRLSQMADLTFNIQSKGQTIYQETVPIRIDSTEFIVLADIHKETKTVDLYMMVSNQGDTEEEYFVEFNINSKADPGYEPTSSIAGFFRSLFDGPSTVVAEQYGPFTIDAKDTQIYAYTYEFNEAFADDYYIKYTLYKGTEKIKTSTGPLQLK